MRKVYLDELKEQANEIINYSKSNITETINKLREDPKQMLWEGKAYGSFVNGYNTRIDKIAKMNENMCKLAEFLLKVSEDYEGTNQKIDNAYEELIEEIKKALVEKETQ